MVAAVSVEIEYGSQEKLTAKIYPAGSFRKIDWNKAGDCELGPNYKVYSYHEDAKNSEKTIDIAKGVDGNYILHFRETKRYSIRFESNTEKADELLKLKNENNKFLRCERDENLLSFRFINYLGRSHIISTDSNFPVDIPFEVIPDKIDYEEDYIRMTEDIAKECTELLMDYSGATSDIFSISEDNPKTLLEQFIFLRQFCLDNNIEALFEAIRRNPDRCLEEEYNFKPYGTGIPLKKLFTQPFSYAKRWQRVATSSGSYYAVPQQIAILTKRDSLDTPANRFLKYALNRFNDICEKLITDLQSDRRSFQSSQTECEIEAESIHSMIDDILRSSFFDDVGEMNIIPQNNTVLQKRQGYAQIFQAYGMIDLALRLDWKGKDDIYEGESKNVALLYEYWLFFVLYSILKDNLKFKPVISFEMPDRFLDPKKNNLVISLREGRNSCQGFISANGLTKVNLYYNRVFTHGQDMYSGSYSRPFRPDFTLAVFPASYMGGRYNGEEKAAEDGAVIFLHFDAKYRVTDLTKLFGKDTVSDSDDDIEVIKELEDEKTSEVINTYKRGDLLKMHTYNDAIRRTTGSYVLYPGNGKASIDTRTFQSVWSMYDEILPGVGAFAIKPENQEKGKEEIAGFIRDAIKESEQKNSRISRLRYFSNIILREPPSSDRAAEQYFKPAPAEKPLCVIGYLKMKYYRFLNDNGLLENGKEFLFYYYAIKGDFVYSHHKNIDKAQYFRMYINDINKDEFYKFEPVQCKITYKRLVSKSDLVKKLNELGYSTDENEHTADFYYVLKIRVIDDNVNPQTISVHEINSSYGNDCSSPHSPKVIPIEYLQNLETGEQNSENTEELK